MPPSPSPFATTHYDDLRAALSRWRRGTLALLWITYAAFYLCRVNLAGAQRSLARDRGLTGEQLGLLLTLLKSAYAVGQVINGVLADRLGARVLVTAGLAGSAGVNLVFAHLGRFRSMAPAWALNGYLQSCGWTSIVRTIANWFPTRLRDAASGIIGTSYILGSGFSWILAGQLTERFGWRYAFWGPAWVCLGVAVLFLLVIRQRPGDLGLPEESEPREEQGGSEAPRGGACGWCPASLLSPRLWALALANMSLFFGYHGLLDWTPHYLADVSGAGAAAAARTASLGAVGGAAGCLCVFWLSRRRGKPLGGRLVAAPILALAALVWIFPDLVQALSGWTGIFLFLMGFLSAGPASLMACAMPANIADHADAGAAAGVVDATGYVGSALSGYVSGRILERTALVAGQEAAWRAVWRTWPVGLVMAAVLVTVAGRRD